MLDIALIRLSSVTTKSSFEVEAELGDIDSLFNKSWSSKGSIQSNNGFEVFMNHSRFETYGLVNIMRRLTNCACCRYVQNIELTYRLFFLTAFN